MSENDNKYNKEKFLSDDNFAEELVRGLESTTRLIHSLLSDIKENSELIITLKSEVEDMKSQLAIMEQIVRGGPSGESLLTRFALLEKDVEYILKELDQKELSKVMETGTQSKDRAERMKVWVGAIISIISAIIAAVATYFSKV